MNRAVMKARSMAVRRMFMTVSVGGCRKAFDPALTCHYMMGKSSPCFNVPDCDLMTRQDQPPAPSEAPAETRRPLTPAASRALAEAEARRQAYREKEAAQPKELGGRGGKEPVRYGDWEVKGLASDF